MFIRNAKPTVNLNGKLPIWK